MLMAGALACIFAGPMPEAQAKGISFVSNTVDVTDFIIWEPTEEEEAEAEKPHVIPAGTPTPADIAPLMPVIIPETTGDSQEDLPQEEPVPFVEVLCTYQGEMEPGKEVTVSAVVHHVEEGASLSYQWYNDAKGTLLPVEGAVQSSYTFIADETTTGCIWQVSITLEE